MTPPLIYVDARALQDPDYRFRGVGQHSASLIEALRRREWPGRRPRLVAVTDVAREGLHPNHRRLFDTVTTLTGPDPSARKRVAGDGGWFLSLSPMTHDPVWAAAFLTDPALYRVALFYDLIPLDIPERYLAAAEARLDYVSALAWLRCYDVFAAISRFSADALIARMAVDPAKVFVSGVAVRRALEPRQGEAPLRYADRRWVVVSGGGDPRKNPECAVIAHARSDAMREADVSLVMVGGYPEETRADLRALHAEHGGQPQHLTFRNQLSDEELHEVYRQGFATVVPSRAEGFSIPIVESSAAGTPVLASDVGAHPELARDPAWRFDPEKPEQLRALLERLIANERDWTALGEAQAPLWRDYTVDRVGEAFLEGLLARRRASPAAPAVQRGVRPSIAVLTPLPPAKSGVADYSVATLRPLKAVADLHLFTSTPNAQWEEGWASLAPVSAAAFAPRRFDATVSVMGNSHFHTEILAFLLERGGACIAHDARLIDFYVHTQSLPRALEIATGELGRPVTEQEMNRWLRNQRDLPILFLSELARAAEPLLVHSAVTGKQIESLYDVKPTVLPFAQYRSIPKHRLLPEARREARRTLDIDPKARLLVTFGSVSTDRGVEDLLWSLKMLRNWSVDAHLAFCGSAHPHVAAYIRDKAADLGMSDHIRLFEGEISEEIYQTYLCAADMGIQLRTYFMGALSGALNDCIGAGLPSIANEHLAEAMMAPAYVRRVPDNLSPVLIAEAALDILASGENEVRPLQASVEFRESHSPEAYCVRLLKALQLADLAIPVAA